PRWKLQTHRLPTPVPIDQLSCFVDIGGDIPILVKLAMSTPDDLPTSATLLRRLRDPADRDAWATFAETYGPRIYSWCRRWHLQEADAEDITQALLVRIPAKMRSFRYDPKTGSFRAWLKAVVRHALADFARNQQRAGKPGCELIDNIVAQQDLIKELDE